MGTDGTQEREPAASNASASENHDSPHRRRPYDREFEPAIREGFLTVAQAAQRNNRQAYASALCRRYGLTNELALEVADNRIRLYEALRRRVTPAHVSRAPRFRLSRRAAVWIGVVAAVTVLGLAGQMAYMWNRQVETARELERRSMEQQSQGGADAFPSPGVETSRAKIERDAQGRITRVTATRSDQVMETICSEAVPLGYCVTLDIVQVMREYPDARVARFTDATDPDKAWIVHLRRDRRAGLWSAGDGHSPLVAVIDPATARFGNAIGRETEP